MKLSQLLTIKSTICLTAGILFALTPGVLLAYFGVPNNEPSGLFFMARLYGGMLFLLGLFLWFSRNLSELDTLRVVVPPVAIGDAFCLVLAVNGQMSEMMNEMGWFVVAFHFFSILSLFAFWLPKRISQSQTG